MEAAITSVRGRVPHHTMPAWKGVVLPSSQELLGWEMLFIWNKSFTGSGRIKALTTKGGQCPHSFRTIKPSFPLKHLQINPFANSERQKAILKTISICKQPWLYRPKTVHSLSHLLASSKVEKRPRLGAWRYFFLRLPHFWVPSTQKSTLLFVLCPFVTESVDLFGLRRKEIRIRRNYFAAVLMQCKQSHTLLSNCDKLK